MIRQETCECYEYSESDYSLLLLLKQLEDELYAKESK